MMPRYRERLDMISMRQLKCNRGQGLVEYAFILILIAIVVLLMVKGIGNTTNDLYDSYNSELTKK